MLEFRSVDHEIGDLAVLTDISLEIGDGEFVLLAGANGSGKTTLLGHCNGLLTPTSGSVLVDGTPVEDDLVAARTAVGMVFQQPRDQFVAATVGEDVAFGPENLGLERAEIDDRVQRALEAVRLEGRETERIQTLSGGEQSRVAIAGALAMEPTHLVLDEPFTGLDEPARQSVLEHLRSLSAAGTGIIVATHDLRDLHAIADRIIAMHDGKIALDDEPERALASLEALDVRVPADVENQETRA
ncbi:energy-coupling factor ABC transporter ATP-binding protein [Halobacteria archaeon AArc-curdl1]|uniref:Energy-coupling factor ABC transporter ATP-binding protein n=1 Tax=Natronosalvus hydrolyticus TaxID=2979988 RepID=A0AAP3E919_9EURY|nr:energy-coupling factor ABC transporter ATP-binding protein [Halobacteria archaeon AArc-curdl1]